MGLPEVPIDPPPPAPLTSKAAEAAVISEFTEARRMLLAATFGILVMPIVLVALALPVSVPLVMAAAFVAGLGIETFGILWDTTMQQEIQQEKLSRLYAYDMLGSIMFVPIGLAVAGPLAEAIGVRETLWAAFVCIVIVTLAVLAVPDVRNLTRR